jgi:holo-[acyl-carrier protein] synthase
MAVGADLVEIRRVARLYEQYGRRFSDRVFTLAELTDCGGQADSLAARWAVKEAVSKALGTGFGPISYREIEVVKGTAGQPNLRLSGSARALAAALGLNRWSISIAHDGGLALAFVVALQSAPDL